MVDNEEVIVKICVGRGWSAGQGLEKQGRDATEKTVATVATVVTRGGGARASAVVGVGSGGSSGGAVRRSGRLGKRGGDNHGGGKGKDVGGLFGATDFGGMKVGWVVVEVERGGKDASNDIATNLVQGRKQRRRTLQVKGSIPLDTDEWYYTRGSGASAQRWKKADGWVLMVSFLDKPERKVTKSNQRKEARSNYSKFASETIPQVFITREEALGYAVAF